MKFFIVLAAAVACVSADAYVAKDEVAAPILRSEYDISPEGNFNYGYETGNGIAASVTGSLKNVNSEYPSVEFKGGYKYTAPDGTPVEISYTADENGFHPQGNLLPVGPAIPEPIARALAYIAAHPPPVQKEPARFA